MADILDRIPVNDEMTIFKTEVEPNKLNACIDSILMRLNRLETSMAKPVKHGKWIWIKDYRDCEGDIYSQYKCSCCDFCVGGVYSLKDLTHFCGNCGTRMDGDIE